MAQKKKPTSTERLFRTQATGVPMRELTGCNNKNHFKLLYWLSNCQIWSKSSTVCCYKNGGRKDATIT